VKDDDKVKKYMPNLDGDALPERDFFFGVSYLFISIFLGSWDSLWRVA
jgi:hypothetical protein